MHDTCPAYTLGIDGLALGSAAAAATDGTIRATFSLGVTSSRAGGLSQRVQLAVGEAEAELGGPPAEVRLVCIDDGGDGSEVALAGAWLADRGIPFRVLDLIGPDLTLPPPSPDPDSQQTRSRARASGAALW
ncbi:MAG: hypothetical protein OEY41_12835 [Acidimicrobiia bacterium]|nr:hypothetical protein [Acidimicrobiia bacterium]